MLHLWIRAMRLHQWAKNALLFVPLVLAGGVLGLPDLQRGLLAFLAFGLAASSIYLINDVVDMQHDRAHAIKRHRPVAAGLIAPASALLVALLLMAGAVGVAPMAGMRFLIVLVLYIGVTLMFTFAAKRIAVLDVLVLAGLYTIRIFAGMMLITQPISYWLLTFSLFFFLSLAFVKRYAELRDLLQGDATQVAGRDYTTADMPFIMAGGVASAFASALLFAIYLADEQFKAQVFTHPQFLWGIGAVLLYWQMRMWFLTTRGRMNQDPILFALTDRVSLAMGALTLLLVACAW